MTNRIRILFCSMLLCSSLATAQSEWDSYENVLDAVRTGKLILPEAENYKITVGSAYFTNEEVINGKAWVHYLIKWSLTQQQLSTSFTLRDTLDPALDGSTVTMLASSNPYEVQNLGKQIYSWSLSEFTENGTLFQGHLYFKVQIKSDAQPGLIRNTAYIELQDGEQIRTTTATIQVLGVTDTEQIANRTIRVWPNPAAGVFYTNEPDILNVELIDAFGNAHLVTCADTQCTVAIGCSSGIYQIRAKSSRTGTRYLGRIILE